jgi:tetratricopeptide (TPR) repeat protein
MLKAQLLLGRRNFDEAIQLLNQLINEEPSSAKAHYLIGLGHLGKGETRIAKAELIKALELNSTLVEARLLLAEIYLRERDFTFAQKEIQGVWRWTRQISRQSCFWEMSICSRENLFRPRKLMNP